MTKVLALALLLACSASNANSYDFEVGYLLGSAGPQRYAESGDSPMRQCVYIRSDQLIVGPVHLFIRVVGWSLDCPYIVRAPELVEHPEAQSDYDQALDAADKHNKAWDAKNQQAREDAAGPPWCAGGKCAPITNQEQLK